MASFIQLYDIGLAGVNVDSSDLHMKDGELRQSQNAIPDHSGEDYALANRAGLLRFNASAAAGTVLGGICVPLLDERTGPGDGELHLYVGTMTTIPDVPDDPHGGTWVVRGTVTNFTFGGSFAPAGDDYQLTSGQSGTMDFDWEADIEIEISDVLGLETNLSGTYELGDLPAGFALLSHDSNSGGSGSGGQGFNPGSGSVSIDMSAIPADGTTTDPSVAGTIPVDAFLISTLLGISTPVSYVYTTVTGALVNPSFGGGVFTMSGTWESDPT